MEGQAKRPIKEADVGANYHTLTTHMDAHEWPRRRPYIREPIEFAAEESAIHLCRLSWALASGAPQSKRPAQRALPGLMPSSRLPVKRRSPARRNLRPLGVDGASFGNDEHPPSARNCQMQVPDVES